MKTETTQARTLDPLVRQLIEDGIEAMAGQYHGQPIVQGNEKRISCPCCLWVRKAKALLANASNQAEAGKGA